MNIESYTLHPGETFKIGTGIAITPPEGYFGAIFARSGLATKQGLRPANCVGVCDEDYTGEYIIAVHNDSKHAQVIHDGDRIAQLVFLPYLDVEFEEIEVLAETSRGSGGFGSTGKA
jgi:dUTP pyrophosphatase